MSHADLIRLSSAGLQYQVAHARQLLRSRYGTAVNWFCYPSGHYDSARDRRREGRRLHRLDDRRPGLGEPVRTIRTASPAYACSAGRAARPC